MDRPAAPAPALNARFERDVDRMSRICKDMSYDPGAMTRMIDRLEAKGLILRGRSTSDRRRVCLELTAAGEAVVPRLREHSLAVQQRLLGGFRRDEAEQLSGYLERIVANL